MTQNATDSTKHSTSLLHDFTVGHFMQCVEMEEKTCTIQVTSDGKTGVLHFRNGELIHAEFGELNGEDAALEILTWDDTQIEVGTLEEACEEGICTSLGALLLEAHRLKDENASKYAWRKLLDDAIMYAERQLVKDALFLIKKLLKAHPEHPTAWVWYSRLVGDIPKAEKILKHALHIDPRNEEVREEILKVAVAKEKIGDNPSRRCPLCWAPMSHKALQCDHCHASLVINKTLITSGQNNIKQNVIKTAIDRIQKVHSKDVTVTTAYKLAIAYFNLNDWNTTLDWLKVTVSLEPNRSFFSDQLNLLLQYMASKTETFESAAPGQERREATEEISAESEKKKKVLVVEDSSTTRKVIVLTLQQQGYSVVEAGDGLEALSRLNEEKPNLILLDIILPKMDGHKILSIIKDNPEFRDIPIIMLTSKDGFMNKMKSKLAGSAAYLTKPFKPERLLSTVEKYLRP